MSGNKHLKTFSEDTSESSKHILIINQYYPPDTSATAKMVNCVAESLAQRYKVTVLCGRPSYNPVEKYLWTPVRLRKQGRIRIEHMGSTTFRRYNIFGRILNYLSYLLFAIPRALTIKADVVISMTDPPFAGIAGAIVSLLKRCPYIYNIQDLHPDMAIASGIVQSGFIVSMWERAHRWALRQTDKIVVLGNDMRKRIEEKGVCAEDIYVVRDGTDIPDYLPSPTHPLIKEIRSNFSFVVMHAGNLGFSGSWKTIIKATRYIKDDGVGFIFIGDGAELDSLKRVSNGISNIKFLSYRPENEVPYVLSSADLYIVSLRKGLEGLVVPSKLYPLLAFGKPVLAVVPDESDIAKIVSSSGCGVVADPDDPVGVANAIFNLRNSKKLRYMGKKARSTAYKFEKNKELDKFLKLVEKVLNKK